MQFTRRKALSLIGGTAVAGGTGFATLSGSAAAQMTSTLDAGNPGTVTTDDGNVTEVFVNPRVYTKWEGFDEKPEKVRYILEAGIEGQGFKPVYRETPWLFSERDENGSPIPEYGTSDRYPDTGRVPLATKNSAFYDINGNGDFVDPNDGSKQVPPKVVLYKEGMDDYYDEASAYPDEAHWTGASLGSDAGGYANGNYGVVGDTTALDAATDGNSKSTTVHLRLTTVLLKEQPTSDGGYESVSLMQDEYPAYSGDAGYTYQRLRNIAPDNPGVSVSTTSFDVTAENEGAESGTHGDANPGVK
ncbi:hypothetical protein SAMN04487948_105275 [Halogranum amylolyticum]|uniref:Uncharacterized protein n=1 Tax=Halogranum amylolyticum TaxID=660520 RepID=A0A1H8SQV7_9EURY|nr:hypothetical protein [Halogranum amylolyticum]SEO81102.1 hypothetical protein SAMN04487948_105275 [Halogranum amylolyticum]